MRIFCSTCEQTFEADNDKAAGVDLVTCLCGSRLRLRQSERQTRRAGHYTLVNQIATGTTGEVWFALTDGRHGFVKEVAVKRLAPNFVHDLELVAHLAQDARISARMNHPNIAQVYDLVQEDDGCALAMEYVPGIPLNDLLVASLRTGLQLPWELGVVVVVQLLRALHHAHHLPRKDGHDTFIHRDIAPQNLLITEDAQVKVIDFGTAKAFGEARHTDPNIVHGKLCYQTPERLHGAAADVQTDLFPAAIILYECWAMRGLFRGATPDDTLRKIAVAHVPSMRQWRDDVPISLERAMRRGLSVNPTDRYQDASAFEKSLLQACAATPFERMRAVAAAFLQHHATLLFAPLQTHKRAPDKMSDVTREWLLGAGEAPPIAYILRDGMPPQTSGPTDAPTLPPGPRRHTLAAAALTLGLLSFACFSLWRAQIGPPPAPPPPPPSIVSALPQPTVALPSELAGGATQVQPQLEVVERPPAPAASLRPAPGRSQLNRFFRRHSAMLLSCFAQAPVDVRENVQMQVAADGTVSVLFEDGQWGAAAPCLAAKVAQLRFPPFAGDTVDFMLPLNIAGHMQHDDNGLAAPPSYAPAP